MANTTILDAADDEGCPSARSLRLRYGVNARAVAFERARKLQASGDINGAIKWLRLMERVISKDESL